MQLMPANQLGGVLQNCLKNVIGVKTKPLWAATSEGDNC